MAGLTPLDGECVAVGRALQSWHGTHRFCANCGAPSVVELSGWQRKCPSCATQHFPRTDPVVFMAITHGDRLLLGGGPSWPERMYSLLAGFVEPGETIEAAVRRETLEESAVRVGPVSYVANQPWPFPMSLMFGCHGEALTDAITIDPVELADARWVSCGEVKAILSGEHPSIGIPRKGAIAGALITAWAKRHLADARNISALSAGKRLLPESLRQRAYAEQHLRVVIGVGFNVDFGPIGPDTRPAGASRSAVAIAASALLAACGAYGSSFRPFWRKPCTKYMIVIATPVPRCLSPPTPQPAMNSEEGSKDCPPSLATISCR
jgi:8-oxo-dGTP pyrophosphatase MutT (NUDIX family)